MQKQRGEFNHDTVMGDDTFRDIEYRVANLTGAPLHREENGACLLTS